MKRNLRRWLRQPRAKAGLKKQDKTDSRVGLLQKFMEPRRPRQPSLQHWVRETGGIDGEPSGLEADAFAPDVIRAAFIAAATPYLRAFRPLDGLCALLEEAARRRLDACPLEAVVAQIAALAAGELLALVRHLRPRLVPSEEPPVVAVAERIVQMDTTELRELGQRLRERLAAEA